MAYIGKTPVIGNFQKCDSIAVVNGQAAYTLQVGGTNVSPQSENHMLVSLNGILQAPVDSFTVSGSTLTFASNLVTGDVIDFVMILGNVLDLGVPSDNTVSLAKLTATGTKDSTTFLRGDNTFASAGVTGSTIRAVSHVQDNADYSHSNQGFTNFGSGISYTPITATSRVMAFCDCTAQLVQDGSDDDSRSYFRFGTDNASGTTIYENTDTSNSLGYGNITGNVSYFGTVSTVISNCQRNSSGNVVVKLGAVSNQDNGTTIFVYQQRVVFMEIE